MEIGTLTNYQPPATNAPLRLCPQCLKPEHGTAACVVPEIVIDFSCKGMQF